MPSKTKSKDRFEIYPLSNWSVSKYGVTLYVNNHSLSYLGAFKDGISLDVEDDEKGNFVGIGLYAPTDNTCFYWSDWDLAKGLVIPRFVAHNGRSDLAKLRKWGFKIDERWLLWDTQLMAHVLDSSRRAYGLKKLAKEDLGIEYPSYEDITGKKGTKQHTTLDKMPLELVAEYNACDCYTTYKLYEKQRKAMRVEGTVTQFFPEEEYYRKVEQPSSFVFQALEERGVAVDLPYLKTLEAALSEKRLHVENEIKNELGTINLNSPKQLLEALRAKDICPVFKGKPSTDKRALERHRSVPIIGRLIAYSELDTLLSSFVVPYLSRNENVVHPSFNQCGTRTGRPSCSNPNLLQIPRKTENGKLVRRMFKAREGSLFGDCDFGQIEPRLLACLSEDKILCQMFNEGTDFHDFTSDRLKIERERAKILNLSVGYRATYKSVSQQLHCGYEAAQKEIDKWWGMFPGLYDWQQRIIYEARTAGYCTTLMGRRIKVEDLTNGNEYRREAAERQLINNITQGSAAEVMKMSMVEVHKAGVNILIQVYDELLFEEAEENIQQAMNIVIEKMEHTVKLNVPLVAEGKIGPDWASVH